MLAPVTDPTVASVFAPRTRIEPDGTVEGYADDKAPINGWRAPRAPLEAYASFDGFES